MFQCKCASLKAINLFTTESSRRHTFNPSKWHSSSPKADSSLRHRVRGMSGMRRRRRRWCDGTWQRWIGGGGLVGGKGREPVPVEPLQSLHCKVTAYYSVGQRAEWIQNIRRISINGEERRKQQRSPAYHMLHVHPASEFFSRYMEAHMESSLSWMGGWLARNRWRFITISLG